MGSCSYASDCVSRVSRLPVRLRVSRVTATRPATCLACYSYAAGYVSRVSRLRVRLRVSRVTATCPGYVPCYMSLHVTHLTALSTCSHAQSALSTCSLTHNAHEHLLIGS